MNIIHVKYFFDSPFTIQHFSLVLKVYDKNVSALLPTPFEQFLFGALLDPSKEGMRSLANGSRLTTHHSRLAQYT
jgi:hypothetical protein